MMDRLDKHLRERQSSLAMISLIMAMSCRVAKKMAVNCVSSGMISSGQITGLIMLPTGTARVTMLFNVFARRTCCAAFAVARFAAPPNGRAVPPPGVLPMPPPDCNHRIQRAALPPLVESCRKIPPATAAEPADLSAGRMVPMLPLSTVPPRLFKSGGDAQPLCIKGEVTSESIPPARVRQSGNHIQMV